MASNVTHKTPSMMYPATYRISISGHLDTSWSDRLAGMSITTVRKKDTPNLTILEGRLLDQAALTGVLNTLYDLQLPLVSVTCMDCSNFLEEG